MDIGDIIRLIFFGFLFMSLFGGLFGRKSSEEEARPPRPTELSQSGGAEPTGPRPPQPQPSQRPPVAASRKQRWENETSAAPERRKGEVRERYENLSTATYDDAIEAGDVTRENPRRQPPRRRSMGMAGQRTARAGERAISERELTDMPPAMDLNPENRTRRDRPPLAATRRRRPATGGDVLRRTLKDSETLERSFIVKEVLDTPLGLRKRD